MHKLLQKEQKEFEFDLFYSLYPRKQGKEDARKCWGKLNTSNGLFDKIMNGVRLARKSKEWQDKDFIPLPATWLRGKRWEDEYSRSGPGVVPERSRSGNLSTGVNKVVDNLTEQKRDTSDMMDPEEVTRLAREVIDKLGRHRT